MRNKYRILSILVLILAIGAIIALKRNSDPVTNIVSSSDSSKLPALIDLGADKCIPCKMMAPILDELKEEYRNKLEVTFIDVWKNPDSGRLYGIQVIPTQIFFDPSGNELFRHEGFYSKEDILAKWKELGYDLRAVN